MSQGQKKHLLVVGADATCARLPRKRAVTRSESRWVSRFLRIARIVEKNEMRASDVRELRRMEEEARRTTTTSSTARPPEVSLVLSISINVVIFFGILEMKVSGPAAREVYAGMAGQD